MRSTKPKCVDLLRRYLKAAKAAKKAWAAGVPGYNPAAWQEFKARRHEALLALRRCER